MHAAMSMRYLARLYKKDFLENFYDSCYAAFIQGELEGDKSQQGAKMQIAEVFSDLIFEACCSNDPTFEFSHYE